jgi:molybdate/tungstate transport system substrate-binding protein
LLALLETNTLDYIFIYRSVAAQHGLKWVTLPDEINLKRLDYANQYARVSVTINGSVPGEVMTIAGEPMIYGVTIPKNANNPELALAFVTFLLEKEKGLALMEKNGQTSVIPTHSTTYANVPETLKKFVLAP